MSAAIETKYNGYRFRSRLEARWAVFFDALGIKWEYEKEGYELECGRYLPDFFLPDPGHGDYPSAGYWIEIKGNAPTLEEIKKAYYLCVHTKHHVFIVHGLPLENPVFQMTHYAPLGGYLYIGSSPRWADQCAYGLTCAVGRLVNMRWDYADAAEAARSARFEFGEHGA